MSSAEVVALTRRFAALGAGFVVLVLAGTVSSAQANQGSGTTRCTTGSTAVVIGKRQVCLRDGGACRRRFQAQYRRHGYVCQSGFLWYDWKPLRRPLHIPTLTPGSPCPATAPRGTIGERGVGDLPGTPAFGPGPAFPMGLSTKTGSAVLGLTWAPAADDAYAGWWGTKVLWGIPGYYGAVLIRGGQLDGSNRLGFDIGPRWTNTVLPELRLVGPEFDLHPAATFVQAPGCYAYQVDTFRSSYLIVLEAQPYP
jgi:hypothetical protein